MTEAIKGVINIPAVLTGGITDASAPETLLKNNQADLIGVGRAILKDSLWAQRAMSDLQKM